MHLHIAFASDDNYIQHLGVAIISLLENNKGFGQITIHILDNQIGNASKATLSSLTTDYGRTIIFHDLKELLRDLKGYGIPGTISIASYSRLFLPVLLDTSIDRVIYADCDAIFEASLEELYAMDISPNVIAAVEDHVGLSNKTNIGISEQARYINAGLLLLDLQKMRAADAVSTMTGFIKQHNGNVQHHDQGVINGVFSDKIFILPPRYNAMTSFWEFRTVRDIEHYYDATAYYPDALIQEAKEHPVFVHFTPCFSNRPWYHNSSHPLKNRYLYYKSLSPWKDTPLQKDRRPFKFRVLDMIFKTVGPKCYKMLFK